MRRKDHLVVAVSAVVLGFVVAQVECHVAGDGSQSVPVDVHLALPMWTEMNWRFGVKGYLTATEIHCQYRISSTLCETPPLTRRRLRCFNADLTSFQETL